MSRVSCAQPTPQDRSVGRTKQCPYFLCFLPVEDSSCTTSKTLLPPRPLLPAEDSSCASTDCDKTCIFRARNAPPPSCSLTTHLPPPLQRSRIHHTVRGKIASPQTSSRASDRSSSSRNQHQQPQQVQISHGREGEGKK
jgi:hypothetical protein